MASIHKGRISLGAKVAIVFATYLSITSFAHAACVPPESQVPQAQVQSFMKDPGALLSSNPTGGGILTLAVRNLVASDKAALPVVLKLLSSGNPLQRAAIGSGLASATQLCLVTDQIFAGEIQAQLVATDDRVALTAFVSGGGQDTASAAIGSAPADTAYISGNGQVTGTSQTTNPTTPIVQSLTNFGANNPFTFNGSSNAASGRANRTVSP